MLLNEGGYARANYVCFLDDWKILVLQKTKKYIYDYFFRLNLSNQHNLIGNQILLKAYGGGIDDLLRA